MSVITLRREFFFFLLGVLWERFFIASHPPLPRLFFDSGSKKFLCSKNLDLKNQRHTTQLFIPSPISNFFPNFHQLSVRAGGGLKNRGRHLAWEGWLRLISAPGIPLDQRSYGGNKDYSGSLSFVPPCSYDSPKWLVVTSYVNFIATRTLNAYMAHPYCSTIPVLSFFSPK